MSRPLCCEIIHSPIPTAIRLPYGTPAWSCGAPGVAISLPCVAGRPDATAGPYCEAHGGARRATDEAERDWCYLAPAGVGDVVDVQDAGCLELGSEDAILVLRDTSASMSAGRRPWLAQRGIGSHVTHVGAYATREEALAAGLAARRVAVAAHVEAIREARGGTLGWGVAVEPRAQPIIVEPRAGESAWDAYARVTSPAEPAAPTSPTAQE